MKVFGTFKRACTLSSTAGLPSSSPSSSLARQQLARGISRISQQEEGSGLGLGNIRTGLDAIHRVEVPRPEYLRDPMEVAVIGAPMTWGQPYVGTDRGPEELRQAGLRKALTKLGWRVNEIGDLDFSDIQGNNKIVEYDGPGNCLLSTLVGAGNEMLYNQALECAENGSFVLTIGGDHSIGLGTVASAVKARPDVGVIWVDAHADINHPEISDSGNMHGMPLSFLTKIADPLKLPGLEWMGNVPRLDPQNLVYVGLRDIDKDERAIIKEYGIRTFTMKHVDEFGIGKVMEMALDHLGNRPIHCSYDIDACDPVIAPGSGTLVRGGLTYREAHYIAEAIAESGNLVSADMVEVNPILQASPKGGKKEMQECTMALALALVASLMGNRII